LVSEDPRSPRLTVRRSAENALTPSAPQLFSITVHSGAALVGLEISATPIRGVTHAGPDTTLRYHVGRLCEGRTGKYHHPSEKYPEFDRSHRAISCASMMAFQPEHRCDDYG
jgi:hypothetical protein